MFQLSDRLTLKPRANVTATRLEAKSRPFIVNRWVNELARRYVEYHAHAQQKIRAAAVIGVLGFPIFYLVWTYVLPQPYDSLVLRGIGTGLCLALALTQWWPVSWRRYTVPFSYFTFLYCLPFFFTLLLLLNNSNATWEMSTLAALIYVVLLYDLVNAIVVLVVGSIAAIVAYLLITGGAPIPAGYWTTLPILIFALTGFLGLAYGDNVIAREKLEGSRLAGQSGGTRMSYAADRNSLRGRRLRTAAGATAGLPNPRQARRLAPACASAHYFGQLGHRSVAH